MAQRRSTTDLALLLLGFFAWGAAGMFGAGLTTTRVETFSPAGHLTEVQAPNVAAGGAAGGFALAGAVCFVGAAFAARDRREASPQAGPRPESAPWPDRR